jgi:hypothetical protein
VDVDGGGGGLDGRKAVMVVGGVEQFGVPHAGDARYRLACQPRNLAVDAVLVAIGPAIEPRDNPHPVRAERVWPSLLRARALMLGCDHRGSRNCFTESASWFPRPSRSH